MEMGWLPESWARASVSRLARGLSAPLKERSSLFELLLAIDTVLCPGGLSKAYACPVSSTTLKSSSLNLATKSVDPSFVSMKPNLNPVSHIWLNPAPVLTSATSLPMGIVSEMFWVPESCATINVNCCARGLSAPLKER